LITFILLASAIIQLTGSFWIGYISDDYDLLIQAQSTHILKPLEGHHFSPVVIGLFKLAGNYSLSPILWHCLALCMHAVNTVLVFSLVRTSCLLHKWPALTVTTLFALSAAGYEALAWVCSIGYVLVLPCILVALLVALTAPAKRAPFVGILLVFLQICAFAIWDWGILMLPLVVVSLGFRLRQKEIRFFHAFLMLWPSVAVWCMFMVLRTVLNVKSGYHGGLDGLTLGAKIIAAAPLTNLLPNTTTTLLKSTWGILGMVIIWAVLCWSAMKDRVVALAVALYIVCVIPIMLFGSLQSRYAYIATPFLGLALVQATTRLKRTHLSLILGIIFVVGHTVFAIQRSQLWASAYCAAKGLRTTIDSIHISPKNDLVVVNLPDSFGPPNMIWRPFLWRNGITSFLKNFKRVNTPGCPFVWYGAQIPVVAQDQVASLHPNSEIYVVTSQHPEDWHQFLVKPLESDNTDNSDEQPAAQVLSKGVPSD
jgi:hypothetical protein